MGLLILSTVFLVSSHSSKILLINVLWTFIGRFGYLAIGLLTNIILVRMLGPKEFGQVGIMMFFIATASVLAESGLSGALVRKPNATEIDYSTIFIFNFFVSLLLMALLICSSGFIADFYEDSDLSNILIATSLVLVINSLRVTQNVRLIKELQFKRKTVYEFIAALIASLIAILLAFNGAGVWALIALQLSTSLALTLILWFFVGPLRCYRFSKVSFKEFYKFGINTTLASLLNSAFDNIYQLILAKFFSVSQTGYFYQAKKLQGLPVGILQAVMDGAVYSALSKIQNDPDTFNRTYQNVVRLFTIMVALMCMVIFYYSDLIVTLLYGEKWIASVMYLKLLIVASFFYLQESFNRIIFKVYDRTEKILQLELIKKLIQSITIVYGLLTMSIENLLYGFVIMSSVSFLINYYFARKVQNYFRWKDFLDIIKIIIITLLAIAICESISVRFNLEGLYTLWLLPLLLSLYLLGLQVFKIIDFFSDIKALIRIRR